MDTLQCAIVLAKLDRFEWELQQRQRAGAAYDALLSGRVRLVGRRRDRTSAFAQYTVVLDERERVQAALHAQGIPTAVHYPVPMHQQPAYARLAAGGPCPVACDLAAKVMSLPMGPYLDDGAARQVAEAVLTAAGVPLPAAGHGAADPLPAAALPTAP
jgi:UDP-2-acetamido-2-deoxy-ribo-hexuluronate aminotransferase